MSKIIALSNHKGGVGKTTSAINIGAALTRLGKRVLLVDLDPQANLTQSLGITDTSKNVYGALRGLYGLEPITRHEMDVIPSTLDLSGAEVELAGEPGREYILREILEPLRGQYDYILIDTPPSLGLLTINSFTASQEILIPLQAEYLATQGLAKLIEIIEKVRSRINPALKIGGVFMTRYDSRKVLNRDVAEAIAESFEGKVFTTRIRDNISLAEAPARGADIFTYDKKSAGAEDYLSLTKEIIGGGQKRRSLRIPKNAPIPPPKGIKLL